MQDLKESSESRIQRRAVPILPGAPRRLVKAERTQPSLSRLETYAGALCSKVVSHMMAHIQSTLQSPGRSCDGVAGG